MSLCASAVASTNQSVEALSAAEMFAEQQKQIALIQKQLDELKAQVALTKAVDEKAQAEKLAAEALVAKSDAQDTSIVETGITVTDAQAEPAQQKPWQIKSYGSMRYKNEEIFRNTQDLDPTRRSSTDLERVVLEFVYDFDAKWQVELELEYEHGGTGSALEYDGFEEFGEFETEIEAGGEVIVEKLQVRYLANENFAIKMGRIFVPVGMGTDLHKPHQYMTAERHWSEATMIPQTWNETGINLIGTWNDFSAQALVTTGLNSEYFRTYKWVASGHQKRFEQVNSDELAFTFRVDYGDVKKGKGVGVSYYTGNTNGNRNNQNNIEGDGNLQIFGVHGAWTVGNWLARGQYLFGQLEDSDAITLANKTTPGLKPGNFSQLGSESDSSFVELGYNAQGLLGLSSPLRVFGAYDYANPMKAVQNGTATPRFDKQEFSLGVNYLPIPELIFKAQFSQQQYAQDNLDNTHSVALSLGYYFSI